jgi:TolA-binding protein
MESDATPEFSSRFAPGSRWSHSRAFRHIRDKLTAVSLDEREYGEIRRDIAEAHAVATRTHNAVATLAASLKEVVTRQAKYERGLNLNSFIAYILFTVLLGGGFYLLYRSRSGQLAAERDAALRKQSEAAEDAATVRRDLAARDEADKKAGAFYGLLKDGKKADAIAQWPDLQKEKLGPVEQQVLQEGVARARTEIVDAGYTAGVEAVRGEQWKKATSELKRALTYEEEGPRAAQMRYFYGVALTKQGDYQEAVRQLETAMTGGVEKNVGPDVRYYLAMALDLGKQLERARTEYLKFADAHPNHQWAMWARHKAAEIARAKVNAPD